MLMLSVDTASAAAGVALTRGETLLVEYILNIGRVHSQTILPLIDRALDAAGLAPSEIDAFAVDIGPGSFTGVRIGVSSVNALAAALDKPVIPADSLEVLYCGAAADTPVCAALDARSGNLYAALYGAKGERIMPPSALTKEALKAAIDVPPLFLGDGGSAYWEFFQDLPGARLAPAPLHVQRPYALALAALRAPRENWVKEARPLYLRKPQAERMMDGA